MPERFQRVRSKLQVYKTVWIAQNGEEAWTDLENAVIQQGAAQEMWQGYLLIRNSRSGTFSVKPPSKRQRQLAEVGAMYETVDQMFRTAKTSQGGESVWDQDGEAIMRMLLHMSRDTAAEYRHALIMSESTTRIERQTALQKDIIDKL